MPMERGHFGKRQHEAWPKASLNSDGTSFATAACMPGRSDQAIKRATPDPVHRRRITPISCQARHWYAPQCLPSTAATTPGHLASQGKSTSTGFQNAAPTRLSLKTWTQGMAKLACCTGPAVPGLLCSDNLIGHKPLPRLQDSGKAQQPPCPPRATRRRSENPAPPGWGALIAAHQTARRVRRLSSHGGSSTWPAPGAAIDQRMDALVAASTHRQHRQAKGFTQAAGINRDAEAP